VVVMISHQWHVVQDGAYFEYFQETALFSDGLLVMLACVWGWWALIQLPSTWWPWVYRAGLAMLVLNAVYAIAQASGCRWTLGAGHPVGVWGVMGVDRALGAYAVAWLPLVWQRTRWLVWLPLLLIVLAGKITTWLGVLVVSVWMYPRLMWLSIPICLIVARWWTDGTFDAKLSQRWMTWTNTWQAIQLQPWAGWGFGPMIEMKIRTLFGYVLPGLHSDWLSLAFRGGVVVAGSALGIWVAWCARWRGLSPMARALTASLIGLACMSAGQAVISQARIGGLALVLWAWLYHETQVKEAVCNE
jgi:hypothetical protein